MRRAAVQGGSRQGGQEKPWGTWAQEGPPETPSDLLMEHSVQQTGGGQKWDMAWPG